MLCCRLCQTSTTVSKLLGRLLWQALFSKLPQRLQRQTQLQVHSLHLLLVLQELSPLALLVVVMPSINRQVLQPSNLVLVQSQVRLRCLALGRPVCTDQDLHASV